MLCRHKFVAQRKLLASQLRDFELASSSWTFVVKITASIFYAAPELAAWVMKPTQVLLL